MKCEMSSILRVASSLDRNTLLLIAGRVVVFFISVFLVLTLIFLMFFVVSDEYRLLPRDPRVPQEVIIDDLKLGEPRGDQYINFLAKMISGEFFLSVRIDTIIPTSDFIYDDVFATALRLIATSLFVVIVGFGYAYVADKRPKALAGKAMRAVALTLAVLPIPGLYFAVVLAINEWVDINGGSIFRLSLYISCGVLLTAASALVFDRVARSISSDHGVGFLKRAVRALATPTVSALLPFLLALVMTSILTIEWIMGYSFDGIGAALFESFNIYDSSAIIACVFIVGSMLLIMFLVVDIIIILASGPHAVRHRPEKVDDRRRRASFWTRFNAGTAKRVWVEFKNSRTAMIAMVAFILLMIISLLAPVLATVRDPHMSWNIGDMLVEPSLSPSPDSGIIHPLGTDYLGRDVYSMLLYDSLDAVLLVIIMAMLALVIGISFAVVGNYARRLDTMISRSFCWVGWAIADVFLCLILLLSAIAGMLIGGSTAFFVVMLVAWILAPYVKIESTRTLLAENALVTAGGEEPPPSGIAVAIEGTLHIAKFVALFGFLSAVMIEFILPGGIGLGGSNNLIDLGWANTMYYGFQGGGLYRGWWWMFVPQIFMICLVGGLSYVILDRLERVFGHWSIPCDSVNVTAASAEPVVKPET